ncbi:MAG: FKBP-type peptidyl-prolyl cis-trans isomerase [Bacteroidia bacterium]
MKKYFLLGMMFCANFYQMYAQTCEKCKTIEDFHAEDCYTSATFQGKCAQFNTNTTQFYFQAEEGKKPLALEINKTKSSRDNLIALAGDTKLKLTGLDVLFLEDALAHWKEKLLDIRVKRTAATTRTESELQAMEFTKTQTGLEYKIIEQGDGKKAEPGKAVQVHYRGYLTNGTIFDESFSRGQAFGFDLGRGRVIRGWDEGIALLKEGDRAVFRIPAELAYGSRAMGDKIPANSVLVFEVVLMKVAN